MLRFLSANKIIISVFVLFIIGIFGANLLFKVKKIESGEIELSMDSEKLKNTEINLPKIKNIYLVTSDDPSAGNPSAKVHIVEFSDFQCPYCKQSYPVILKLIKEYGDKIHFVYRDFPIPSHTYAQKAAEAAECAQDQGKFWEMHNMIFDNQSKMTVTDLKNYAKEIKLNTDRFNQCLDAGKYTKEVENDFKVGQVAGVRGTPAFFINDNALPGYLPFESMKKIIDQELARFDNSQGKSLDE